MSRPQINLNALLENFSAALPDAASNNPVKHLLGRLETAFVGEPDNDWQTQNDDCRATLDRFLTITGQHQQSRRVFEAMPHLDPLDNVQTFRSVLLRLGFLTTVEPFKPEKLRSEFLPCFLLGAGGAVTLVEGVAKDGGVIVFEPATGERRTLTLDALDGVIIFPEAVDTEAKKTDTAQRRWSMDAFRAFKPVLKSIFLLGFAINLLALIPPLFVMHVYDKAIGANALDVLIGLTAGVVIVLGAEFGFRMVRGKLQSYLGARLDNQINEQAFHHLLYLPITFTESAPVGSQLVRLNQITSIRDAFIGPLATAIFDLPFLFIFIIAIALIGGPLVFVPVSLIVAFVALAAWAAPATKRLVKLSGDRKAQLQNLTVELASHQKAIYDLKAEDIWLQKHRKLSAECTMSTMKARQLNNLVQTVSQSFVTLAGVMTLAIGVNMVVAGDLTAGALIAVMALSWRVLGPIRGVFLSSLTLGQTLRCIEQIDRLLRIPLEREPNVAPSIPRTFEGPIVFDRISFRYPTQKEPALRSVSFNVKQGELMCICGASGSGKSTTLRMLIGLYQQQAGSIFVGGVDLRQIDAGEWRQALGVAPETSDLFFGTVTQNFRLAAPSASDARIEEIAAHFKLEQYFGGALNNGLETKITGSALATWPEALKKRLILCRTFISDQSLYLLDNPADNLDDEGEQALLKMIEERRAASKIIMTTHRPSHMRLADKLMWLEYGAIREIGAPNDIVPNLLAA